MKLWSLLAPPVFVCVVFGIFSRRADNRGAIATLAVGTVLGFVAFVALDAPTIVAQLPAYLRNALNVGFVITLVCTAVMLLVSRGQTEGRVLGIVDRRDRPKMTESETRRYRWFLGGVAAFWILVVLLFSPWGIAAS